MDDSYSARAAEGATALFLLSSNRLRKRLCPGYSAVRRPIRDGGASPPLVEPCGAVAQIGRPEFPPSLADRRFISSRCPAPPSGAAVSHVRGTGLWRSFSSTTRHTPRAHKPRLSPSVRVGGTSPAPCKHSWTASAGRLFSATTRLAAPSALLRHGRLSLRAQTRRRH